MHRVARKVHDKRLLRFIGKYLRAGVKVNGRLQNTRMGVPQGGPLSPYYRPIPELDHWLRRRVRMCYWKQWRLCRTKVRNLLNIGVSLKAAISFGMSRKGPWHLARTLGTQAGMTNQWLKKQGVNLH